MSHSQLRIRKRDRILARSRLRLSVRTGYRPIGSIKSIKASVSLELMFAMC